MAARIWSAVLRRRCATRWLVTDGNVREMVLFHVDQTYRLQAFLLGCAESPKPLKKQKKGLLGAKMKRPFSILHTPGLACIRDNYSPQEMEKHPFLPGQYKVLQENVNIQSQENRIQQPMMAFPPPALESTAIAKDGTQSSCRSKAYSNLPDLGCSPSLPVTDFSPIPSAENEIAYLVDSCCSAMHATPVIEAVVQKESKDEENVKSLEPNGPDVLFTELDRKEKTDTEFKETLTDQRRPFTPKSDIDNMKLADGGNTSREFLSPDSFLNDSLSMQTVDRKEFKDFARRDILKKPRKSWTPHRKSPLRLSDPDQSSKIYLSPDSFLNDSIVARQSGIGATPGTPFTETAQAFNHEDFEKSVVSPNSFLEELNSTRNDSMTDDMLTCIPSPAILSDVDTHNIFMRQLRSRTSSSRRQVRVSAHGSHITKVTKTTRNVNFSVAHTAVREKTTTQTKSAGIFAPTLSSSRRATFVTKKSTATSEKTSSVPNAPSPRRATFLVAKKNHSKKVSPQVHQHQNNVMKAKKLSRSQRFTNIHKADVEKKENRNMRRRSCQKESTTRLRKTKTEAFIATVEADAKKEQEADVKIEDEVEVSTEDLQDGSINSEAEAKTPTSNVSGSSATVTKSKPSTEEERRLSAKELHPEDERNSSATVTKEKKFMDVSSEDKPLVGKCLLSDFQRERGDSTDHSDVPLELEDLETDSSKGEQDGDSAKSPTVSGADNDTHSADLQKIATDVPDLEKLEFGSPSMFLKNVVVDDIHVGRMSMTVTKERPSLSTIKESESKSSTLTDTPKAFSQLSVSSVLADTSQNGSRRFSGKKLFGADPMSPSKSPILSSIFRDIGSPSRLPSCPDVEMTRRITLTVTKSKPSEALQKSAEADQNTTEEAYVVGAREETYVHVAESTEGYCRRKKILRGSPTNQNADYNFKKVDTFEKVFSTAEVEALKEQTTTWEMTQSPKGQSSSYTLTSPMFTVTPQNLPDSPHSENSRRSTHVVHKPKVINQTASPRRLFPPLEDDGHDSLVIGELSTRTEKVSNTTSVSSIYSTDSLEGKESVSDTSAGGFNSHKSRLNFESKETIDTISEPSMKMDESVFEKDQSSSISRGLLRSDLSRQTLESKDTIDTVSEFSMKMDESVFEKEERQSFSNVEACTEDSQHNSIDNSKDSLNDTTDKSKDEANQSLSTAEIANTPETSLDIKEKTDSEDALKLAEIVLEPKLSISKESMPLLKSNKELTKMKTRENSTNSEVNSDKRRRWVKASKVSPIASENSGVKSPEKNKTKNDGTWFPFVGMNSAEKENSMKIVDSKHQVKKPVLSRLLNPSQKKRRVMDREDKENIEKENGTKKRSKSDPTESNQPKKQGFLSRLASTGRKAKPTKPTVKGVAPSKLILVKKEKRGIPKHPMPFAAKNMYYDERWIEKQDRGFVHWLNFVLTPPDEYNTTASKAKVDAGSLTIDYSKVQKNLAPTKEILSIRVYTARRRLNRLRRAACMLYQSQESVAVIRKVEYEVEKKRISVRKDRMVHADIGIKQKILDLLLSYNPLWLRMGLETTFGEVLPIQSNSDVIGLSRFILGRLLGNPDIEEEYAHPTVPHLYREGYAEAIAKHALKKYLLLVHFLDQAKLARLIQHDPCLFCKDADIKASKDMLFHFSRDYLSGEGDITKHLAYMGYTVSHTQTALDEFDYAVTKLGVDLRDGLRLTRVLELMTGEWNLVKCLRAPAISRLQKIHNIDMVFKTLAERGLDMAKTSGVSVNARDIVDGHREKTLKVLWHIIFHFQVDVLINLDQLKEEVALLEQSLRVKVNMQRLLKVKQQDNFARRDSGGLMDQDSERLELLLKWCRTVCLHYGIKIENFTVSFSDGRALCCLLHHYHPGLLPLSDIKLRTSQSYQQELEDQDEADLDLSQDWNFGSTGTAMDDPELFEELLSNERENFKTLYEKVSELGGIPLMLKAADMSNTIPDEKVVVTYVSYLCGRLLDIRQESRAARVIQIAWRNYRLRHALREQHHEIRAARVIQTKVRQFLQRKRSVRQARAATVLQAAWRGQQARSEARLLQHARDNAHLEDAVVKIQTALQCFAARKKFLCLRKATITVQSHIRGHLTRKEMAKQQYAANIIQDFYRAHKMARKQQKEYMTQRSAVLTLQRAYREVIAKRHVHKSSAAVVVQKAWQGYKCRKQFVSLKKSTSILQRYVRAKQTRQEFLKRKRSAVSLQRRFRANKAAQETRQDFLIKKQAAMSLQAQLRGLNQRRNFAKMKQASQCIQKHFRGHKYRVKFQAMRLAAIVIQRAYRFHKMAANEKEELRRQMSACVSVQRWWRKIRQEKFEKQTSAAVLLQSHWRRVRVERKFIKSRQAAIVIQKNIRCMQAQKHYKQTLSSIRILQSHVRSFLAQKNDLADQLRKENAVVQIQACWRRHSQQNKYLKLRKNMVVLQSHIRCWIQRQHFNKQKESAIILQSRFRAAREARVSRNQFLITKQAAITIQSTWRGYVARQVYLSKIGAVVTIQSWVKKLQTQTQYKRTRTAAIVLQRRFRAWKSGKETRTQMQETKSAVIKVQATVRCLIHRQRFLRMRQAAIAIQKYTRMQQQKVVYQKMLQSVKEERAAVTLQRTWRMVCQRKRFNAIKKSCIFVQKWFRDIKIARKCRRRFLIKKGAAITIQAVWRGYTARSFLQKQHKSATKIQASYKAYRQRSRYQKLRHTVISLQERCRRNRECIVQKQKFQTRKQASVLIQKNVRMFLVKRSYQLKTKSCVTLQRAYRCHRDRKNFLQLRHSVIVCQRMFRNNKLAKDQRRQYCKTLKSVITLQSAVRRWLSRRHIKHIRMVVRVQSIVRTYLARKTYLQTLRSIVLLQSHVKRCIQRKKFLRVKQAAKTIQERWRSTVCSRTTRKHFLIQVGAAITIQQGVRSFHVRKEFLKTRRQICLVQACIRGFLVRKNNHQRGKAAKVIQGYYRASTQAKQQRKKFLKMKSSALVLQSAFRKLQERRFRARVHAVVKIQSTVRTFFVRREFCRTLHHIVLIQALVRKFLARLSYRRHLEAILALQRNIRTFLFINRVRKMMTRRHCAACIIQTAYRKHHKLVEVKRHKAATVIQSTFRMYRQRKQYKQTQMSAILIQRHMRGLKVRRTYREMLQRHRAAKCLQSCYRSYRVRVQNKKLQAERQAQLEIYIRKVRLHFAALRIQTWYRKCVLIRHAKLRLHSVVLIQRRVRAYLERVHYLKLRRSVVLLQQQCRVWLLHQQHLRAHIYATRIQALWRGYHARKNIKCKKINRARARVMEASLKATDTKKLGYRTASALDYLLEYKSLSHILEALMHLEVATRLSPKCCERLVEVHAVHVIYRLIRSCNRSTPHMELIKYSVNILLNLAKYDKTVEAVHDVESAEILVDLLQIYREKGHVIFSKTCTLIGILALEPRRRMDILQKTQVVEKIRSIQSLVSRKNKVEERQKMVRAKLAAARSFNSTLPLPTPTKRRKIKPEWALSRDSLASLREPLPAINFVLENLKITAK